MKKKIVLITGYSGFIGGHLVQFLSGCENIKLLHPNSNELNLLVKEDVVEYFKLHQPDIIVHCAAVLPDSVDLNKTKYFNNILDANIFSCAKLNKNVKVIYISGTSVYLDSEGVVDENSAVGNSNPYIQSKIDGEEMLRNSNIEFVILRVSAPFGQLQRIKTVIHKFIECAINDQPLFVYGNGERLQNFTYINDLLNAINIVISKPKIKGIFNICSDKFITMKELAELIINITNSKSEIISLKENDPDKRLHLRISNSKAKSILNWKPIFDTETGLKDMIHNK